jgi:hypothetical protein
VNRIVTLVVLAVFATGAALMNRPDDPSPPEFGGPGELAVATSDRATVWYCPWVNAGADREAAFLLASLVELEATMTLPSPILNEEPDTDAVPVTGPGSRVVDVGSIVRRGDAPGFVEFDDGPAVAAAAVWGDGVLTVDRCVAAAPKIWHLTGATTREGTTLRLRLFNPFPDDVKVGITGASEFGAEPLPEFSALEVPGRSWVNLDLDPVVPFLDDLALVISATDGVVIPVMVLGGEGAGSDEASWPGTGLSTTWYFAGAGFPGLASSLSVTNPADAEATVVVDVVAESGSLAAAVEITVPPRAPARIPLDEYAGEPFGIRVQSSQPIGAVVTAGDPADEPGEGAEGEDLPAAPQARFAGTVGAERAAQRWLLPGAGAIAEASSVIWVLNPAETQVTVSLEPLGVRNLPVDKLVVPAGTVRAYRVPDDVAIASYLVEAPEPIVVSWTAETADAVAFAAGFPTDG